MAELRGGRGMARWLPQLGFGLALLALALAAFAGWGHRFGWWHFTTGFSVLRWGFWLAVVALPVSALATYLTRPGQGRPGLGWAVAGLAVALAVIIVPLYWLQLARVAPPIHEITTDVANPPQFVDLLPLRADAANPPEYGGPAVAAQQRAAYPEIGPALLPLPADQAFDLALAAARNMGWTIVASVPEAGRIEAVDTTFWFGFRDDVAVRLVAEGEWTRVDVRSKSRVGRGDAGSNARRVRDYLAELEGLVIRP